MPVNHHVLLRFNLKASKEAYLHAAKEINLAEDIIKQAESETDQSQVCKIISSAILDKICRLKEIVNLHEEPDTILEARWSKNRAIIPEDLSLTEMHGVSHKIEMTMKNKDAVEKYFNHSEHIALVDKFKMLEKEADSIFLPGGFAIPFDTQYPLTPRTIREIAINKEEVQFDDVTAAQRWALTFKGQLRVGGFSRNDDLKAAADAIEKINPDIAQGIREALSK